MQHKPAILFAAYLVSIVLNFIAVAFGLLQRGPLRSSVGSRPATCTSREHGHYKKVAQVSIAAAPEAVIVLESPICQPAIPTTR